VLAGCSLAVFLAGTWLYFWLYFWLFLAVILLLLAALLLLFCCCFAALLLLRNARARDFSPLSQRLVPENSEKFSPWPQQPKQVRNRHRNRCESRRRNGREATLRIRSETAGTASGWPLVSGFAPVAGKFCR
jgi:hypothetical protein